MKKYIITYVEWDTRDKREYITTGSSKDDAVDNLYEEIGDAVDRVINVKEERS